MRGLIRPSIGALLAYLGWNEGSILSSLGFYLRVHDPITFQKRCSNMASVVGASFLVAAFLLIDSNTTFPGFWALLPTMGAALVIVAGPHALCNYSLLSSRIMVAIGLISYPLYLWHWPVLSFSRIKFGEPAVPGRIAIACVSTFLAWLTYKWVEKPLRSSVRSSVPVILTVTVGVIGSFGAFAYKGWISNDRENDQFNFVRQFEETKPQFLYLKDNPLYSAYRIDCDFLDVSTERAKESIAKSCITPTTKQSILIWGDSHAQQLNYGLRKLLPIGISILQVATSGCNPSLDKVPRDVYGACNKSNQFAMSLISTVKPDLVLLAQQKGHELVDWDLIAVSLKQVGVKEVLLVGPVPKWHPALYKKIARKMPAPPERVLDDSDAVSIKTDNFLKNKFQDNSKMRFVSLHDVLCNQSGCLTFIGGSPLEGIFSIDDGHLTTTASLYIAKNILANVILQSLDYQDLSSGLLNRQ